MKYTWLLLLPDEMAISSTKLLYTKPNSARAERTNQPSWTVRVKVAAMLAACKLLCQLFRDNRPTRLKARLPRRCSYLGCIIVGAVHQMFFRYPSTRVTLSAVLPVVYLLRTRPSPSSVACTLAKFDVVSDAARPLCH
jgi:hypothetical protein